MVITLASVVLLAAQQTWIDVALAHEWEGRFDHALVARAAALRENDTVQQRRELARAAAEYEHLRCVLRIPVRDEAPVELDNTDGSIWAFPLFGDGRGPRLDTGAGRVVAAWKDLRLFSEDTGRLLAPPVDLDDFTSRHGGIGMLELDPTGRRVAVVFTDTSDHALYVFELATGEVLLSSTSLAGPVAWSPTGSTLAFAHWSEADNDTAVTLRSFAEEGGGLRLDGFYDGDEPIRFSRDGRWVALPGKETRVFDAALGLQVAATQLGESDRLMLDAVTGEQVSPPRASASAEDIDLLALSSDGRLSAAVQAFNLPGRILVWDNSTGRQLGPAQSAGLPSLMATAPITSLHITDAGRVVACQEDGVLRIFETSDLVPVDVGLAPGSHSIVTDDTGEAAVLLSTHSRITVLGAEDGVHATCRVQGAIEHLAISGDGTTLAWAGAGQGAWKWRTRTSAWETSETPPPRLISPASFPEGVALEGMGNWDLGSIFHRPSPQATSGKTPGAADAYWRVLISPPEGSPQLLTDDLGIDLEWRSGDRVVPDIEDLLPNTPVSRVERWHLAPDRILATYGGGVDILDPVGFRVVARISPFDGHGQSRVAGDRILVWHQGEVRLYDAISGNELLERAINAGIVAALPVSGTSKFVIVEPRSSAAGVSLESLEPMTPEFEVMGAELRCAGSKSGLFSLVDDSGAIHMLDSRTGRNWILRSSDGREVSATWLSPDGSRLAAFVAPASLLLYETRTGEVLYQHDAERLDEPSNASAVAERWCLIGEAQFDPTSRTFLWALRVQDGGTSNRPTYGRATHRLMDARTGSPLGEYELEPLERRSLELLAGGTRLLVRSIGEVQLLDAANGDIVQAYPNTAARRVPAPAPQGERVVVVSDWKAGTGGQLATVDLDSGAKSPIASDFKGRGLAFGRDPLGRYLCLSHGEHWVDLHTGEPVVGAPVLEDYTVAGSAVAFGPDGLVLVSGTQLGRIQDGTFERIGRRRWTASEDKWNKRSGDVRTGGTSFLSDRRVLVHAYEQGNNLVPVVLDFGPATCSPLAGTPSEILESWCQRLALELKPEHEIAAR